MQTAYTQITLHIHAVWSKSMMFAHKSFKVYTFLVATSVDPYQIELRVLQPIQCC